VAADPVAADPVGGEPVAGGLFRVDADGATLLGGRSTSSGLHHFPRSPVCPYTGADDVEDVDLPRTGTLWGWTTVTSAPPGYPGEVPYGLGVVELMTAGGPLRVIGRLVGVPADATDDDRWFGTPMEVVVDEVVDDAGAALLTWAFAVVDPGPAAAR
jgi:uncharacterized OB-fold protein